MDSNKMNSTELQIVCSLCTIFSLRMMGIFMILPVLTNYGMTMKDANESLIGLAIGIYGLIQAIFQIPVGLLSDKIGRKSIIIVGLIIFLAGSIIAAMTDSIWGVILGRALQGSGAITAVIIALLSDSIRKQNYTKAMMFIGMSFSLSFAIALILGPVITHAIGIHGLFWIISILTCINIIITSLIIPTSKVYIKSNNLKISCKDFKKLLTNSQLMKINFSIFCLHAILISSFIALPLIMTYSGILPINHWKIYVFIMVFAFILMVPFILYAEKKYCIKSIILISIIMLLFSELFLLINNNNLYVLYISMQLFFLAFNIIEAILPSILSKESPIHYKGTAIGIYLTSQFLGSAFGGILGGWSLQLQGTKLIFIIGSILTIIWCLISFTFKEPPNIKDI